MAKAHSQVAAAIDGLHPADVIRHLETTVAQAQIEASRLGISFEQPVTEAEQLQVPGPDGGPVVVIRRLVEDDPS